MFENKINKKTIENEYAFLEDCIHVNCCSVGVPPVSVREACKSFYDGYMELVYGRLPEGYGPLRQKTREKIASLINCSPLEVAFINSTSMGLSVIAGGYPLGKGDNIVIPDLENMGCMIPWVNAGKNRGFEVRVLKTEHGRFSPDDLFNLADKNTKVIALSAVQYGTGFFADLKTIGAECRKRGIILVVDAIQAIGRMKIDVKEMNIDFLSCGGFKGTGAGFGIGFLYCEKNLAKKVLPSYAGLASVSDFHYAPSVYGPEPPLPLHEDARRFEIGSHNTIGIVLLEAAVDVILELGIENIEKHILALELLLRKAITGINLYIDGPEKEENYSGILVIHYPEELHPEVTEILERHKIILTSHPGFIRLAIHCYNTEEQMQVIANALIEISKMIRS